MSVCARQKKSCGRLAWHPMQVECDSYVGREGTMARMGFARWSLRESSLSLIVASSVIVACSGQKRPEETAQQPSTPAMTPMAGRSNGGAIASEREDGQWVRPAKNYASTRFSGLNQITGTNVGSLRLAWTFETGILRGQEAA